MKTLAEIKDEVAKEYGSNNYKRDFEYGLGISKLFSFEEFMEEVAKLYAKQALEEANKAIDKTSIELYRSEYQELEYHILNIINELK